jgi:hypothetical protein
MYTSVYQHETKTAASAKACSMALWISWERLQRPRKGENVPPPLDTELDPQPQPFSGTGHAKWQYEAELAPSAHRLASQPREFVQPSMSLPDQQPGH